MKMRAERGPKRHTRTKGFFVFEHKNTTLDGAGDGEEEEGSEKSKIATDCTGQPDGEADAEKQK